MLAPVGFVAAKGRCPGPCSSPVDLELTTTTPCLSASKHFLEHIMPLMTRGVIEIRVVPASLSRRLRSGRRRASSLRLARHPAHRSHLNTPLCLTCGSPNTPLPRSITHHWGKVLCAWASVCQGSNRGNTF